MPNNRGSFTPASGILFTQKRGLPLFSNSFSFFLFYAQLQHGNSQLAHLRSKSRPRTLDLARDVMQLHVYLVPSWTAPSGRDLLPPAGFRPTRAAMTSPGASKNKPRSPTGSPREHMCSARP